MKATSFSILFFFSILSCFAQGVNFETSLKTAFEKAKQENKLVFVEYYDSECPVCKRLEPVFLDNELGRFYNEHFINYKLNIGKSKLEDSLFIVSSGLKFESVPYFLFFDSNRDFVHYSGTKQEITYLIAIGQTALDPQERTANLYNKYNSGDRSIKTLYAYSNLLQLYKKDSLRAIIADELFAVFPKDQLSSEKSYIITKNCVSRIENGFFVYWINHIDEIKTFEKNEKHETNVLGDILFTSINSNERNNWDLAKIKAVKEMVVKTGLSERPNTLFWEQESRLLVKANQDREAMDIFLQMIANDSDQVSAAAYTINYYLDLFENISDLNVIKTWIDNLSGHKMDNGEKAGLLYCDIHYYKKINDYSKAKQLGQAAIAFYKENNLDAGNLTRLLADL